MHDILSVDMTACFYTKGKLKYQELSLSQTGYFLNLVRMKESLT